MIIRLENLVPKPVKSIGFKENNIWEKENVLFESGNTYIINARSGVGKTSLLSIIYGIRKDYFGDVFIENINSKDFSINDWTNLRKEKISYVFQGLELFPELSVFENIQIKNQLTNYKSKEEIFELADLFGIKNILDKSLQKISYGQKQRVAIIRALCQPFEFLFLDEPFSHLDKENKAIIMETIKQECKAKNAGIIIASLNYEDNESQVQVLNM